MQQTVFSGSGSIDRLGGIISDAGVSSVMLVRDGAFGFLPIRDSFDSLPCEIVPFEDFVSNPDYSSVEKGVELLRRKGCGMIVAVGGGSALDVAKCIKLYACNKADGCLLDCEPVANSIPLVAVPTTAGTGSEATRYAVVYRDGAKQSVTSYDIIPQFVILDPNVLSTLPMYQRKATMMDALCHGIESMWSVNSTEESRGYAETALKLILECMDGYLDNDPVSNGKMLQAANFAGRAINVTQTTAGHAMCYKITSMFGYAHGHAASVCLPHIFRYMLDGKCECADPRGENHVLSVFDRIAGTLGCDRGDAPERLMKLVFELGLAPEKKPDEQQLLSLVSSVNPVRLKNNPYRLSDRDIEAIYRNIFSSVR